MISRMINSTNDQKEDMVDNEIEDEDLDNVQKEDMEDNENDDGIPQVDPEEVQKREKRELFIILSI